MTVASSCVILLVVWTLLAYVLIPLPFSDPFFAWLRRQWLMEGIAGLTCIGVIASLLNPLRTQMTADVKGADDRRLLCGRPRWWLPWCAWLLWVAVSLTYSIDRGASLRAWLAFASYGLLAWLASTCIRSTPDLLLWVRFLAWIAVVVSLEGFMQYGWTFHRTLPLLERLQAGGQLELHGWGEGVLKDFLTRKRIFSVFGWPNLYAGFLLLTIPLTIGLSRVAQQRWSRIGWLIATSLLSLSLILTLSMGGWFAAILTACLSWALLRSNSRFTSKLVVKILIASLALCLIVGVTSFIVASRARPMILGSTSSRFVYVRTALHILHEHPLAGTGIGTFGLAYWALMPLQYATGQHSAIHAHNTLAEVGAELGLVGLGLFLWFVLGVWRLVRQATRADALQADALSAALAIGVVGFFVHSLLEQTFFEAVTAPFWWIVLGLLSGRAVAIAPNRVRFQKSSAVIIASIALFLAARFAMADAWAANGAWRDLSLASLSQVTAMFERARQWDPLASRYPLEEAERLADIHRRRPSDDMRPQWLQARASYERAVALSPWLGYAWMRLGDARWQLGDAEGAVKAFREAVRRDPNSSRALLQLAHGLSATHRFEEVPPVAQRLQRLEPADPNGWLLEALAWQALQQPVRAKPVYEALVHRRPAFYPAWFNLARLLDQAGDRQGAIAAYRKFLETAPVSDPTRQAAYEALQKENS